MRPAFVVLVGLAMACVRDESLGSGAAVADADCLSYEDTVTLHGELVRETHPGRPDYESIQAGDEPEAGFYLHLQTPVCTRQGRDDATEVSLDTVRRVQLVLDSVGYAALRPSLRSSIDVRGTMFSSHTGHHHAPLLLIVHR